MPLLWAALAGLAAAFAWGVASLLFGRLLRDAPAALRPTANAANLSKVLLAVGFFGAAWLVTGDAAPDWPTTRALMLSGALGFAVGDSMYLAALPRCGVQTAAMIGLLNVLVAALLGWALFGEALAPATIGAMAVVLLGVCLVLMDRRPERARDPRAWRLGVLLALLNALCIGTAVATGFGGMQGAVILPATLLRVAGGALALCLMGLLSGCLPGRGGPARGLRELARPLHTPGMWRPLFVAGFFGSVLGLWPYHYALQHLPPGVSAIVFSATPLFTLPLGLLFGERHGWRTVLGTLVGFAGVAAVVWSLGAPAAPPELEVRVLETPAGCAGRFPRVASNGARAWALWTRALPGERFALQLAELEPQGFRAPTTVASGSGWFVNWADTPALAVDAHGPACVTWLARNGDGVYTYEVRVARRAGAGWSADERLHVDASAAEHGFVSLAPLPDGSVQALWLDGHATGEAGGAMALRTGTVGAASTELELDARVCDCCPTALARTDAGALVAAYRDRGEGEVRDLAIVRRPAGADAWTQPRIPHADGWRIEGCPVNGPALAAHGERVALVAFSMGVADEARVWLAISRDAGATFGARVRIDDGVPAGQVDVAFLAADVVLVSWLEQAAGAPAWRARAVTLDGARGAPVTIAEVPGARSDGRLRLARARDGVVAVWTDPERDAPRAAWITAR